MSGDSKFHLIFIIILDLFLFRIMINFYKFLPLLFCNLGLILFFFNRIYIIILQVFAFILVVNSNSLIKFHYPE